MRFIFSGPCFFCSLRLSPRRRLCALSAPSAFNNYVSECKLLLLLLLLLLSSLNVSTNNYSRKGSLYPQSDRSISIHILLSSSRRKVRLIQNQF
ncbi:hypothetical protein Hanom_Chr15g01370401 [Helianthus anomalus]